MKIRSEVAGFALVEGNSDASSLRDEFVHGRAVGGYDDGSTTHCFDDIVAPAFGKRRAKVDEIQIQVALDFFVAQVIGEQRYIFRN